MPLEWTKEYSVNVQEIDEQHKEFIDLINRLSKGIKEMASKNDLGNILNKLDHYAKTHFATEEKYFKKFDYPDKDKHIVQHRRFSDKIKDYKSRYKGDKVAISFEVIDFLEDWLVDHLLNEDQKYSGFFNEHGLF